MTILQFEPDDGDLDLDNDLSRRQVMGSYYRRRRDELGLTQERVALHLRISVETYRSWENGRRNLRPEEMTRLLELLDLPFWTLRKVQSLVFTRHHQLQLGTWPPQITAEDWDHLAAVKDAPAAMHGMPQYDVFGVNEDMVRLIPGMMPAPHNAAQPVNAIALLLRMFTEGDDTVGNLELVLTRMIWLLKTMGVGIVEQKRMQQIRTLCREINHAAFEDMWRTELSPEEVGEDLVLLRNSEGGHDEFTMRCKEDVHPFKAFQTYIMARRTSGAELQFLNQNPDEWARRLNREAIAARDALDLSPLIGDGSDIVGMGW